MNYANLGVMAVDPDFFSSLRNFIHFIWVMMGVLVISAIYCFYYAYKSRRNNEE